MESLESVPLSKNGREAIDAAVMLLRKRFSMEKVILLAQR